MSAGTLSFVDQFVRWRDERPSHWVGLYEEGKLNRGLMDTASANSIVTDSAAAAAAWGCGYRVNNGALNITPDGKHRPTILQVAKEAGKATGLITTAPVTHATPAGFGANVERRNQQPLIAEQYFDRRWDLILGGGSQFFDAGSRNDGRDLAGEFADAGYGVVRNRKEMKALESKNGPMLGLFARGNVPYELDRLNDEKLKEEVPSLAEMTRAGLERLNRREEGFVVQVEGARVDHAAHSNDIGGLVYDQIAFDDAIAVAVEFAEKHGDTLVIITTDHGNANPGMNSGNNGGQRTFSLLNEFRSTQNSILGRLNRESSVDEIVEAVRSGMNLEISKEHADLLYRHYRDEYQVPYRRMNNANGIMGQIIANHTDIGWVGNSHTSDHVEVAAMGPGSGGLRAYQKNTDLFTLMTASLGLEQAVAKAEI